MAVLSSESNLVAEVMLIAALTMNDGSENALLGHVGNHHLIPAIDTVFQKHHWYMGPLIGIYDLPALLNGISASHFTAHIFSCFHKFNSQIQMVFPGGAKDDRIHCINLQNLFIIQGGLGAGPPALFNKLCRFLAAVLIDIADSCKFHILMMQKYGF